MESSRKRKASMATSSTPENGATKRIKLLNSHPAPLSTSKVKDVGHKILAQLRNATDKTRRSIITEFLELPDRDELPDYFEFTRLPVALETVEEKLKKEEYPTITTIESDLKRMVQNAKDYNDPNSQIYEDAEKIRKLVFNFMKQHNPAYTEQPGYTAFPTPLPSSSQRGKSASRASSEKPKQSAASRTSEQPDRKPSVAPSATPGEAEGEGEEDGGDEENGDADEDLDFTGKSFQEAQQAMISYLLQYTDDEGLQIYTPFGNLPTRKLEDYYKIIRHPVSLKSIAKRIKGKHGRTPPTGVSDFKTWDAFAEEVGFIWRNAKEYNEDGSDMYNLAIEFEEHFQSLLDEARAKVDEPSGPKIKIGGPKPKVTLSLSHHRKSPTPGIAVDKEALSRQNQVVQAGVNGQQAPQRPAPNALPNGVARPSSQSAGSDAIKAPSSAYTGSPMSGPVKVEKRPTHSPAPNGSAPPPQPLPPPPPPPPPPSHPLPPPLTNGIMPPPLVRPMSGSPFPQPAHQPNNTATTTSNFHYTAPALLPPTQNRSYPLTAALLPTVTISTHPQLKVPQPFRMPIAPHPVLSHQSTTITLPSSHYFLQIAPTISKSLSMGRPYKMFVSVNGARLTQRDTMFHADSGKRTHVYEGSLAQGVNRIEVEVAAAKQDGNTGAGAADGGGDGKGLDVEKVTVFANLMR